MQILLYRTMDLVSWLAHRVGQFVHAPMFVEPETPGQKPSLATSLIYLLLLVALGLGFTLCFLE